MTTRKAVAIRGQDPEIDAVIGEVELMAEKAKEQIKFLELRADEIVRDFERDVKPLYENIGRKVEGFRKTDHIMFDDEIVYYVKCDGSCNHQSSVVGRIFNFVRGRL
jgi:hypothetical protein